MSSLEAIDTIILAGGLGTRLHAALPGRQKVLAVVDGRPFVEHLVGFVTAAGIRRIVLAVGHHADQVLDWLGQHGGRGIDMRISVESAPRGTGGALRLALRETEGRTILVMNGDSFAAADLEAFVLFHQQHVARVSMVLVHVEDVSRYGRVDLASDGEIRRFEEKTAGPTGGGFVNAGIYLFDRDVIEAIPADRAVSLEREVFPAYCGNGLYGMTQSVPFIDIGTSESWEVAGTFFGKLQTRMRGQQ